MDKPSVPIINILLVEDDPDDIGFFTEAMQESSIRVKITIAKSSGQMFSHLDNDEKFDLIFLDINLPIINGIECLKLLKESIKYKLIPVIMLSGSHAETDINETYKQGAHHYMAKPYSLPDYEFCLKEILELNWKENHPQPAPDKYQIKPIDKPE